MFIVLGFISSLKNASKGSYAAPSYSESKAGSSAVTHDGESIPEVEELSDQSRFPEETSKEKYRTIQPQLPAVLPG